MATNEEAILLLAKEYVTAEKAARAADDAVSAARIRAETCKTDLERLHRCLAEHVGRNITHRAIVVDDRVLIIDFNEGKGAFVKSLPALK